MVANCPAAARADSVLSPQSMVRCPIQPRPPRTHCPHAGTPARARACAPGIPPPHPLGRQRIEKGRKLREAGVESKNRCHACGEPKRGHICYQKLRGGPQVDLGSAGISGMQVRRMNPDALRIAHQLAPPAVASQLHSLPANHPLAHQQQMPHGMPPPGRPPPPRRTRSQSLIDLAAAAGIPQPGGHSSQMAGHHSGGHHSGYYGGGSSSLFPPPDALSREASGHAGYPALTVRAPPSHRAGLRPRSACARPARAG